MLLRVQIAFRVLIAFANFFWISVAIELDCHKEQKFIKVDQDGLPEVNAMKVVTESHATFCNIKCLDTPGCKSVVFLLSNSTDNCLLSNEMNGARADESVTYIKENHFTTVCQTNPCQHGATCVDTCTTPYYFCQCLPLYFKGERCEENSKCDILSPCQNSGTCSPSGVAPYYTCSCPYPFAGTNCEVNTKCYINQCNNRGHCYTQSYSPYYHCGCWYPYNGYSCHHNHRCDHNPCQHGGTCNTQDHHPYFHCNCPGGRWGDYCEKNLLSW